MLRATQAGFFYSACNARLEPLALSIAKAETAANQELHEVLQALPGSFAVHLYCDLCLAMQTKERLCALLAADCPPTAVFRCGQLLQIASLQEGRV